MVNIWFLVIKVTVLTSYSTYEEKAEFIRFDLNSIVKQDSFWIYLSWDIESSNK